MPNRTKKVFSALKHGGYSGTTLLPGEDLAAFEELHKRLVAELAPNGVLEEETVATIAHLLWRKKNLAEYEITQLSRYMADVLERSAKTEKAEIELSTSELNDLFKPQHRPGDTEAVELDIRKMATLDGLMRELDVEERLDAMIDKCLKRLLYVRGFKSLPQSTQSESAPTAKKLRRGR
jgi:hypothetical protein